MAAPRVDHSRAPTC